MSETLFGEFIAEMEAARPKPKQAPVYVPKPDPVADNLIQHGLVPNTFILDLNHGLTTPHDMDRPYPWNLPSRLFQFPIEVTHQDPDGSRKIGLLHPLLAEHPFVKRLEALGIEVDPDGAPNEHGHSKGGMGRWWHAVDLISSGHWRDLLKTAQFTTPDDIAGAVSYGLQYSPYEGKKRNGHISTAEAREIMAAIGAPEPTDRDGIIREHFMPPSPHKSEKGTMRCPINHYASDPRLTAWGFILSIEAGLFGHDRAGFLGWTTLGMERFPPAPRVEREIKPYVPPAPVEKPLLAEEIAPRPTRSDPQMTLF